MKALIVNAGLAAGLFFIPLAAQATTFGPIRVFEQAQNTQYYVHGRILGASWMEMEPRLGRPYTYWKVRITDQPAGDPLAAEIVVREPGGEIGDMGYHVAGTAEFAPNEDVFIALHDTDQAPNIKEVVGLASGKYRVEMKDGKPAVMSGLGLPVSGSNGLVLGPDEFTSLLRRISRGEATDADKTVYVSRRPTHGEEVDPALEAQARDLLKIPERHPADSGSAETAASEKRQPAPNPAASKENSVQESAPKADEGSTGFSSWGWTIALAVLAGLVLIFVLALKR